MFEYPVLRGLSRRYMSIGMTLGLLRKTPIMATKKKLATVAKKVAAKKSTARSTAKTAKKPLAKKAAAKKTSTVKKKAPAKRSAATKPKSAPPEKKKAPVKARKAVKKTPRTSSRSSGKSTARKSVAIKEQAPVKRAVARVEAKKPTELASQKRTTSTRNPAQRSIPAPTKSRLKLDLDARANHSAADYPSVTDKPEFKLPLHDKAKTFVPHRDPQPNELHRGHTATAGPSHDRPGSQPERVKHQYPNSNKPNAGSARSTQYKGKRRGQGKGEE